MNLARAHDARQRNFFSLYSAPPLLNSFCSFLCVCHWWEIIQLHPIEPRKTSKTVHKKQVYSNIVASSWVQDFITICTCNISRYIAYHIASSILLQPFQQWQNEKCAHNFISKTLFQALFLYSIASVSLSLSLSSHCTSSIDFFLVLLTRINEHFAFFCFHALFCC